MVRRRCGVVTLFLGCWLLASSSMAPADAEFAIVGDAGKITQKSQSVLASIARGKARRLIMPGDNLYSSTYEKVWAPWRALGMTFDVVALGNHNAGYAAEMRYFGMPAEYYSVTHDGARFLVLNSDNDRTGREQAAWLDQQLSGPTEEHVFLVYHHPTYTVSSDHSWREKPNFQKSVRKVIWRHRSKITALIVGHDHLASLLHFDDLPVILSGAVQDVRKDTPVDVTQEGVAVKTEWYFDHKPYWASLKISNAEPKVRLDFIRAKDDQVSCTATLKTGQAATLMANCRETSQEGFTNRVPAAKRSEKVALRR
jgi:hypothetical protein